MPDERGYRLELERGHSFAEASRALCSVNGEVAFLLENRTELGAAASRRVAPGRLAEEFSV